MVATSDKNRFRVFNANKLRNSIDDIRTLSTDNNFLKAIETAQRILSEAGAFLVPTASIPRTNINGSICWFGGRPVIQISDRGKRDDIVWFTLFHEIGHVLLHSKKEDYVDYDQNTHADAKEREADDFAERALVPEAEFANFCKTNDGHFSETAVVEFSQRISVSPSIVVGRLKKDMHIHQPEYARLHKKVVF